MDAERKALLMEFITVTGLVVALLAAVVLLTVSGHDDSPLRADLSDMLKTGFGAILALAYAARGVVTGKKAAPPSPPAPGSLEPIVLEPDETARGQR